MKVSLNHWINLHYTLTDSSGELLEDRDQTARYLHGGFGVMFPKLEAALEGKAVGEVVTILVDPADHFGEYDAQLVFIHPLAEFTDPIAEGDFVDGRPGLPDDGRSYVVRHIANDTVVLDGNHPYSEIALVYEITIDAIALATKEEIELQSAANQMDLHENEDE